MRHLLTAVVFVGFVLGLGSLAAAQDGTSNVKNLATGWYLDQEKKGAPVGSEKDDKKATRSPCLWKWKTVKTDAGDALVLRNFGSDQYLDIDGKSGGLLMSDGDVGKGTKWIVVRHSTVKGAMALRNEHSGKYLGSLGDGKIVLIDKPENNADYWQLK